MNLCAEFSNTFGWPFSCSFIGNYAAQNSIQKVCKTYADMIHPFKTYPDQDYNATLKMNDNATFTTPPPPPPPPPHRRLITDGDDGFCFRISDNDGRRKCGAGELLAAAE
ncbi:hypothetical protein FRACYDRAFT_255346 [Fragilariopsis cylindrus CCMP1102]|uniref:Uncharacterized protein n=1 Tax=Fragilariopsis cylindrus CCMP1102 TaxID=635003 RepID=A0A1E7EK98_9STRA|nr:hypothetical protein FRACYDRAFT_255346 [Fragilariopsis cylindrus CCMP1102]|eukprot:OEU06297.1 hypothetical protein FRACYDRAFT_255346 [Fragilariopsis cylindrus CCMP1102]